MGATDFFKRATHAYICKRISFKLCYELRRLGYDMHYPFHYSFLSIWQERWAHQFSPHMLLLLPLFFFLAFSIRFPFFLAKDGQIFDFKRFESWSVLFYITAQFLLLEKMENRDLGLALRLCKSLNCRWNSLRDSLLLEVGCLNVHMCSRLVWVFWREIHNVKVESSIAFQLWYCQDS